MKITGKDIICFACEDWWYHNPHSTSHIMRCFAQENRVLFVNSIGIRMPEVSKDPKAWGKIWNKTKSIMTYFRTAEKNIYVLTPIALPLIKNHILLIQKINKYLLIVQLLLILKLLNFKTPVLWACVPSIKDVVLFFKRKFKGQLVYYCVDNISFFPGADHGYISQLDIELQQSSDITFFVNHRLVDERLKFNKNTFHLGHGVDFDHFNKVQTNELPVPEDIRGIKKPIAGYMGAVEAFDLELLYSLVTRNTDISFVFIGEVRMDVSKFTHLSNVYFLGKKSYEQLPNYLSQFSCCCLYYDTSDVFNQYRNPKKLFEYLATGKPVISVAIHELNYFDQFIYLAKDCDEFSAYLREAINKDTVENMTKRCNYAKNNTWDNITNQASEYMANLIGE